MTKPYGKGREGLLMLCSVYLIFAVAISWIIKGHRRTERSLEGQDLQCGVLSRMLACWPLCLQASRMRWIELLAPKLRQPLRGSWGIKALHPASIMYCIGKPLSQMEEDLAHFKNREAGVFHEGRFWMLHTQCFSNCLPADPQGVSFPGFLLRVAG